MIRKLHILLNPWRHAPWSRQSTARASAQRPGETETIYLPPREDLNAPDMYIPMMSFVTYILLSALLYGLQGSFHPELLGYTASSALGAVVVELVGLRMGCYLLGISGSQMVDLIAYSGYKFVGVTITIVATAMVGRGLGWGVFAYCYLAQAFFLVCLWLVPASGDSVLTCACIAEKLEVCAAPGSGCWRGGCECLLDGAKTAEEAEDVVLVWVLVCGAVCVYVGVDVWGGQEGLEGVGRYHLAGDACGAAGYSPLQGRGEVTGRGWREVRRHGISPYLEVLGEL